MVKDDDFIITVAGLSFMWEFGRGVAAESFNFPAVCYKYSIISPCSDRLAKLLGIISECVITILAVRLF